MARLHLLGFDPIPLTYEKTELNKLDRAKGLLIPGGLSDLDPQLYGQKKSHPKVKILKARADFEFRVLDRFLKSKKPLLAICWGMQMLNVYLGGSLHQHLPKNRPSALEHEQKEASDKPTHWVHLDPNGAAAKLFKSSRLKVNSTHHQGVDQLGDGLILEGRAEDGLIECARLQRHEYAWAVQWHPERLARDPVIPSFGEACQRRR